MHTKGRHFFEIFSVTDGISIGENEEYKLSSILLAKSISFVQFYFSTFYTCPRALSGIKKIILILNCDNICVIYATDFDAVFLIYI